MLLITGRIIGDDWQFIDLRAIKRDRTLNSFSSQVFVSDFLSLHIPYWRRHSQGLKQMKILGLYYAFNHVEIYWYILGINSRNGILAGGRRHRHLPSGLQAVERKSFQRFSSVMAPAKGQVASALNFQSSSLRRKHCYSIIRSDSEWIAGRKANLQHNLGKGCRTRRRIEQKRASILSHQPLRSLDVSSLFLETIFRRTGLQNHRRNLQVFDSSTDTFVVCLSQRLRSSVCLRRTRIHSLEQRIL